MLPIKIDVDCCRAVLLAAESCEYGCVLRFEDLRALLPEYSEQALQYSALKLKEAGFITVNEIDNGLHLPPSIYWIQDVTIDGHQFLAKIRDEERFLKTKTVASTLRDFSLSAISSIAEGISSAAISAYFSKSNA